MQLIYDKRGRIYNGKRQASSINSVEITGQLCEKNQTGLLPQTMHKNKFKMYENLKCKMQNHKPSRRKYRRIMPFGIGFSNIFVYVFPGRGNIGKNKQMGLHQI